MACVVIRSRPVPGGTVQIDKFRLADRFDLFGLPEDERREMKSKIKICCKLLETIITEKNGINLPDKGFLCSYISSI